MEYKEIKDLAALMKDFDLSVIDYNGNDMSIRMERGTATATPVVITEHNVASVNQNAAIQPSTAHYEEQLSNGDVAVKSPMVGVFYSSPAADKEAYVSIGDKVHVGDVLCIVEAMKIMNEITAEHDGIISEICAENKQVVEFGQPLFRIDTTAI